MRGSRLWDTLPKRLNTGMPLDVGGDAGPASRLRGAVLSTAIWMANIPDATRDARKERWTDDCALQTCRRQNPSNITGLGTVAGRGRRGVSARVR